MLYQSSIFNRVWRRGNLFGMLAGALAFAAIGLIASRVYFNHASLDWDDTEYIELALRWNHSLEHGERPVNTGVRPPFLSLWLLAGTQVFGGNQLGPLLWWGTVVPLGLQFALVLTVCGWLGGSAAALRGIAVLVASPLVMALGGRVMAETFLGFWVLGATAIGAILPNQPRLLVAFAFGCGVGFALITKLSAGVMLLPPCLYVLTQVLTGSWTLRSKVGVLMAVIAGTAICAGPFYFHGHRSVLAHASYSANFDELGLGISDTAGFLPRIFTGFSETFGPAILTGFLATLVYSASQLRSRAGQTQPVSATPAKIHFDRMSLSSVIFTAVFVALPSYYDPRFFMPVASLCAAWLALAAGSWRSNIGVRLTLGIHCCLAAGIVLSFRDHWPRGQTREPFYWHDTLKLISTLAEDHGIKSVANVGNCAKWNSSKLQMISRLAPKTSEMEFRETVRLPEREAQKQMQQSDAIFVLDRTEIPAEFLKSAPAQNLSYESCVASIPPQFKELDPQAFRQLSLPNIRIYLRQNDEERNR